MNNRLSEQLTAADDDALTPEYEANLGLNHTLRIGGLGYVYDPEIDSWVNDRWTPDGTYAPHTLTAQQIHSIIWEGRYRVTTWEVRS